MAKIIGFSGSTVKSGVVEKAMVQVLNATGSEWELIRLNSLDMKQCIGCAGCVNTNRCVLKDEINDVLEKIEEADAVLIGAMARFGGLNALTKQFFERLSALFHNDVLKDKAVASVAGGLVDQPSVIEELSSIYKGYKMKEVGSLSIGGNASCFKCGKGETCEKSVFRALHGDDAKITKDVFYVFEKDIDAVGKAVALGEKLGDLLANQE